MGVVARARGFVVVVLGPYATTTAYALTGGDGVSRARSVARASRKSPSMLFVSGCAPPSTRRAIRSVSSSVFTASRRSSMGRARRARDQVEGVVRRLGRPPRGGARRGLPHGRAGTHPAPRRLAAGDGVGHVGPRAALRGGAVRACAGGRDVHARLWVTFLVLHARLWGVTHTIFVFLVCYRTLARFAAEVRGTAVSDILHPCIQHI